MTRMKNKSLALASFLILTSFFSQTMLQGMEQPDKYDIATVRKELGSAGEDIINRYITQKIQLTEAFDALYFLGGTTLHSLVTYHFSKPVSAIASDDRGVFAGHEDGTISIINYEPQKLGTLAYKNPTKENRTGTNYRFLAMRIAAIAANNNYMLAGGSDGTAKILDMTKQETFDFINEPAGITSATIHKNYALIGLSNNTATLWDLAKEEKLLTLPHNAQVTSVALSDTAIITGSADGIVTIWNWQGQEPFTINAQEAMGVASIATDGEILAIGWLGMPALGIFDIKKREQILFTKAPQGVQGPVTVAIKNGILAIGFTNEVINLYDIKNERFVIGRSTGCPVSQLTASNNFIAILCDTKKVVRIYPRWSVEEIPTENPYLWILENATIEQLRLINRLYKAKILGEGFTATRTDNILFSAFPEHVQSYLKDAFSF